MLNETIMVRAEISEEIFMMNAKLRALKSEEIQRFSKRKNVKEIAVYNFLCSCDGSTYSDAMGNLTMDARMYKWNAATQKAIRDGIILASK